MVCITSRRDQHVPAAVRAAADVRAVRSLSVSDVDRRLGHGRERAHRLITVVQTRLRIEAERWTVGGRMPGVGAEDCEALRERMRQRTPAERARRGNHATVDSTVTLVPEASVPFDGQAQLETDRIRAAVEADAVVHAAGNATVLRHRLTRHLQRARGDRARARDHRIRQTGELRQQTFATPDQRRRPRRGQLRRVLRLAMGECDHWRRRADQRGESTQGSWWMLGFGSHLFLPVGSVMERDRQNASPSRW